MEHEPTLSELQQRWHGTYKSYAIGFFASLILILASFYLVGKQVFSNQVLMLTIAGLALVQAVIQLLFFLHLGQESKPRWETLIFIFMVSVLLIIVLGSLWIMYDLNNRVMTGM